MRFRLNTAPFRGSVAVLACLANPALAMVKAESGEPRAADGQAALVAAYRSDLKDMTIAVPVYLSRAEGELLARHLGLRVDVFMHAESRKTPGGIIPLAHCATFNTAHARTAPLALLLHGRHFSLLRPADRDAECAYARVDGGGLLVEAGEPLPDRHGAFKRVPADGNCLLSALFFIAHGHYPSRGEIGTLREIVASGLSDAQVRQAVADLRADLIQNAAFSPFERGTFASCGPRVSGLLRADPSFRAARERQLALDKDRHPWQPPGPAADEGKAEGKAKPGVREQVDLDAAIARALAS
jgi:hypothetical protein